MTDKEQINKCECTCDECGAECEPFWKKENKEQIIINGVDITGCMWCDFEPNAEPYCRINIGDDLNCEDNPNCYFKKLARKTQELNVICKTFNIMYSYDEETGNMYGRCDDLYKKTQECEELQKEKEDIKKYLGISEKTIMQRLEELTERKIEMQISDYSKEQELSRYRKALKEIEKLINDDAFIRCPIYDDENCNHGTSRKILNIINKAKEEE